MFFNKFYMFNARYMSVVLYPNISGQKRSDDIKFTSTCGIHGAKNILLFSQQAL